LLRARLLDNLSVGARELQVLLAAYGLGVRSRIHDSDVIDSLVRVACGATSQPEKMRNLWRGARMARGLQSLWWARGAGALAKALMLLASLGLGPGGCLVPPPIEEEPTTDGPPVVSRELVEPRPGSSVPMDLSRDPDRSFNVAGAVVDPDGDTLFYYWYLFREGDEGRVAPTSSLGPTFFLRPCSRFDEMALGLSGGDSQLRYLELDIADGPRLLSEEGEQTPRRYGERTHVVTLSWVLVLRGMCP
jgi:hypothetical protein